MDYVGKQVKLLLQGLIFIEGIVKSWDSDSVHLLAIDGKSTSIITNPDKYIILIKIMHDLDFSSKKEKNNTIEDTQSRHYDSVTELEGEFKKTYHEPSNDELRLKKLIDLKKELINQERDIVANKLRSHNLGEVRTVKYERPGFFKK